MLVIRKDPGQPPELVEMENTLEALQQAVGGYIETVTFCVDAAIVCNDGDAALLLHMLGRSAQ